MKKSWMLIGVLPLIASFSIVAPAQAITDCSAPAANIFAGGDGSITDPYQVGSAAALDEVRCYLDKNFVLVSDIAIPQGFGGADNWTPIGTQYPNEFIGTFDGAGYTISGLVINAIQNSSSPTVVGLFGSISGAVIENLVIATSSVTGSDASGSVGTLVGQASNSRIDNVQLIDARVTGFQDAGGLAGYTSRTTLSRVDATSTLTVVPNASGVIGSNLGGLIGYAQESAVSGTSVDLAVNISSNTSNTSNKIQYVGGVFGQSRETISDRISGTVAISANTNATINLAGGVAGSSPNFGALSNLDLDVNLNLSQTGKVERTACIFSVGTYYSSLTDSKVDCTLGVGANSFGIGAGFYQIGDGFHVNRLQLDADLTIGANPERAGFLAADADQAGFTDSIFTGSMNFAPSSSAVDVGLAIGKESSGRVPLRASRTILAIETNLNAISGTEVGGLVGNDSAANTGIPVDLGLIVDQDLLGFSLPAQRLQSTTTTSVNIQSANYLGPKGFDTVTVWQVTPSQYPSLRLGPRVIVETVTVAPSVSPLRVSLTGLQNPAKAGGELELVSNYDQVSARITSTKLALFTKPSANGFSVLIPADLPVGVYDIEIASAGGTVKLIGAISVSPNSQELSVSTKRTSHNTVRMLAQNPIGQGKIQFFVDGREIAWINAVDLTDPKLSFASSNPYLVRSVELKPGKNRFEIKLDGVRVWRATYVPKG